MRLIDADALSYNLDGMMAVSPTGYIHGDTIADMIGDAPTIEPERKKGKWERHYSRPNVYADLYWHCSECGYKNDNQYANVYHKFCPNCGAKMEEGEQDDSV